MDDPELARWYRAELRRIDELCTRLKLSLRYKLKLIGDLEEHLNLKERDVVGMFDAICHAKRDNYMEELIAKHRARVDDSQ